MSAFFNPFFFFFKIQSDKYMFVFKIIINLSFVNLQESILCLSIERWEN